jgi:hypothetical protein
VGSTHRPEPRYLNALSSFSLEELFAAGEAVQSLEGHPGWVHLQRLIQAEIAAIDASLDGGSTPLSRAEYAMAHGRRGGVLAVVKAADAIVQRAEAKKREQEEKGKREDAQGRFPVQRQRRFK